MAENVITCSRENDAAATIAKLLNDEGKVIHFRVFPKMLAKGGWDVSALDLTQRSYNCLKRNGIETVSELAEKINGIADLLAFRNLGQKSAKEIMFKLYLFQYQVLPAEKKQEYLQEVIELNRMRVEA